jgi:hypothetical protein
MFPIFDKGEGVSMKKLLTVVALAAIAVIIMSAVSGSTSTATTFSVAAACGGDVREDSRTCGACEDRGYGLHTRFCRISCVTSDGRFFDCSDGADELCTP